MCGRSYNMAAKKSAKEILDEADNLEGLQTIDYNDMDKTYYPTDFLFFNTLTGKNVRQDGAHGVVTNRARGYREGNMMMVVGDQGIGKTTWCFNSAGGIKKWVDNHPNNEKLARTQIHILSLEDGMEISSIKKNIYADRVDFERGEIIIHDPGKITTEYVSQTIMQIYEAKKRKGIKIPMKTVSGDIKMTYPPTICIIDSIGILMPEKLKNEDALDNNMIYAQSISKNGLMIQTVFSMLREANIMMWMISHKNKTINTGNTPNARVYQNLSPDDKIGGGKKIQYYADIIMNFARINTHNGNKETVSDIIKVNNDMIGYATEGGFVKNRFGDSSNNSKFNLVFDYSCGFNPMYSMLYQIFAGNVEIFGSAGAYKTLANYPDKFFKADVTGKILNDPKFRTALLDQIESKYSWILESDNRSKDTYAEFKTFMNLF